jgi:hypothetical protein
LFAIGFRLFAMSSSGLLKDLSSPYNMAAPIIIFFLIIVLIVLIAQIGMMIILMILSWIMYMIGESTLSIFLSFCALGASTLPSSFRILLLLSIIL